MANESDHTQIVDGPVGSAERPDGGGGLCYIIGIHGPYKGKRFLIKPEGTRIGRHEKYNDIVLEKDGVTSRRHAYIEVRDGAYVISDLSSRKGTYLNAEKLAEERAVPLHHKDEIEIGKNIFRFIENGAWDFGFPRKTGAFWVRYKAPMLAAAGVLAVMLSLFFMVQAGRHALVIRQQPPAGFLAETAAVSFFEQELLWEAAAERERLPHAVLADLNGDDEVEIVAVDANGKLYVVDTRLRTAVWWSPMDLHGRAVSDLTAADLNRNGIADLVLAVNNRIIGLDGISGAQIFQSDLMPGTFDAPIAVADLNQDGYSDLVALDQTGTLVFGMLHADGSVSWESVRIQPSYSAPLIADLDGDRAPDVILADDKGQISVYEGSTRRLKYQFDTAEELLARKNLIGKTPNEIRSIPALLEYEPGRLALAVQSRQNELLMVDVVQRKTILHKSLGYPQHLLRDHNPAPVVADIDLDGAMDLIVASLNGQVITFLNKGQGNFAPGHDVTILNDGLLHALAMSDLNKDNIPEAICQSAKGLYIYDLVNGSRWHDAFQSGDHNVSPLIAQIGRNGHLVVVGSDQAGKPIGYYTRAKRFKGEVLWGSRWKTAHNDVRAGAWLTTGPDYLRILIALLIILTTLAAAWLLMNSRKKLYPRK